MSDYTPTTEEVRHDYCSDDGRYYPEAEVEFNRWLVLERKRVADMAIKKERKRALVIVMANVHKLLEAAKRGESTIDMTWLYEELMKDDE